VLALYSWLMFDHPDASRWDMAITLFCYAFIYARGRPNARHQ